MSLYCVRSTPPLRCFCNSNILDQGFPYQSKASKHAASDIADADQGSAMALRQHCYCRMLANSQMMATQGQTLGQQSTGTAKTLTQRAPSCLGARHQLHRMCNTAVWVRAFRADACRAVKVASPW